MGMLVLPARNCHAVQPGPLCSAWAFRFNRCSLNAVLLLWYRVVTSKEYPVDSKVFFWSLGANPWGRYLRISENGAGYVHCAVPLTMPLHKPPALLEMASSHPVSRAAPCCSSDQALHTSWLISTFLECFVEMN